MSLLGISQSKITKDEHPSTVTTVRLLGGFWGGAETSWMEPSSAGKCLRDSVMEQGILSSLFMYFTCGPAGTKK